MSPAVLPSSVQAPAGRVRDVSIDYLRTSLTLLVVAHHSAMAYTTWAHFDATQPLRSTAPVVDTVRWVGFDCLVQFDDVFFMSLLFFISGLFVYPALQRQGTRVFVRERLLRLGIPFVFAVVVLMPLAFYASWRLAGLEQGFGSYYRELARQGYMVGPPWFIWVLLLFGLLAAALRWLLASLPSVVERVAALPVLPWVGVMLGLVLAVYWPLLAHYGPDTWAVLGTAPFAYQASRIGLYALWFGAGVVIGAPGLSRGPLASGGSLGRYWPAWVTASLLVWAALASWPYWAPGLGIGSAGQQVGGVFLWVGSCVASCFAGLALFRGLQPSPRPWLASLTRCAYAIYLVHYVFLTWVQLLLVPLSWPVLLKFELVFSLTTGLSWLTALALLRVPLLQRIL